MVRSTVVVAEYQPLKMEAIFAQCTFFAHKIPSPVIREKSEPNNVCEMKNANNEFRYLEYYYCERHWIGLVVSISAFGSEGRRFESTKGYTPDRDMCASLLVRVAPHCKPSPG